MSNIKIDYIFLTNILVCSIFCSCNTTESKSIDNLVDFVENEDNNLITKVQHGEYHFSLNYEPVELITLRGSVSIDDFKSNYPSNLNAYNELEYYTFKIKNERKPTRDAISSIYIGDPEEITSYIDFQIQDDIKLVQGTDTLYCSYLHKEVSEAISNELSYSLGFAKSAIKSTDRKVLLKSNFAVIPDIIFNITDKSIKSIPALKITEI